MTQNNKFLIVGLLCFILGAGIFYAWSSYSQVNQENMLLKNQVQASPSPVSMVAQPSAVPSVSPDAELVASPQPSTGAISGTLGYPSEGIPPLEVYAFKQSDYSAYFKVETAQNQSSFTISDLPAGSYVVVAYPQGNGLSGGYTQAVACGLSVTCTDHSLVPVQVTSGQTATGVEVKDWYAPEGTFPAKPN